MNQKFFEMAHKASLFSDYPVHKIGCVVVYKGKIISVGYNCNKSHPLQKKYGIYRGEVSPMPISLHAEISALLKIKDMDIDWKKVEVYIFKAHRDGSLAPSRPCNACMTMIKDMGIKNIFYTSNDSFCHEQITEYTVGKMMNTRQAEAV